MRKRLREEESNKDKIIAELRAEVETLKQKLEAIINDQRLKSRDRSQFKKKIGIALNKLIMFIEFQQEHSENVT